jgi:hypothetical protein
MDRRRKNIIQPIVLVINAPFVVEENIASGAYWLVKFTQSLRGT